MYEDFEATRKTKMDPWSRCDLPLKENCNVLQAARILRAESFWNIYLTFWVVYSLVFGFHLPRQWLILHVSRDLCSQCKVSERYRGDFWNIQRTEGCVNTFDVVCKNKIWIRDHEPEEVLNMFREVFEIILGALITPGCNHNVILTYTHPKSVIYTPFS